MLFKLELQAGTKETGPKYPQVHCLTQKEAFSIKGGQKQKKIPSLEFLLEKKAKPTDILSDASITSTGILCNYRFLSLLEKYNLPNHEVIPCYILTGKTVLLYNYFHFLASNLHDYVIFKKSEFFRTEFGFPTADKFSIKDFDDHINKRKEFGNMSLIKAKHLVIKADLLKKYDIFTIHTIDGSIYITDIIAEEIKNKKISGINILPADNVTVE